MTELSKSGIPAPEGLEEVGDIWVLYINRDGKIANDKYAINHAWDSVEAFKIDFINHVEITGTYETAIEGKLLDEKGNIHHTFSLIRTHLYTVKRGG